MLLVIDNGVKMITNKISRKNFFKRIGLGGIGLSLFSFAPFKILGEQRKFNKNVKVKIHSSAVKRNS